MDNYKKFVEESDTKSFDTKHRATIGYNMSKYDAAVANGKTRYADLPLARSRAAYLKRQILANWDEYLEQFEKNSLANGAEVRWALDAKEAMQHVLEILAQSNAKLVMKSKSMVTEELFFNEILEEHGYEVVETDLGEFIVQTAGEKPYHILTPAMHKSRGDVAKLFNEKFGTDIKSTPEEMTEYVREKLREKFVRSDVGITGANFLVADVGAIALTENEGNGLMSTAYPKTHIVLAGIEKLIPSIDNLATFWPVVSQHGTGQHVTAYNSLFFGPKKANEANGPERMVVILIDNGRTNLYKTEKQYEALSCIRCGACLNACPIYRNVGGYTYNTTYSGPIGSVITPHFKGMAEFSHLSYACTLCMRCAEVCPVKIDLPQYLLLNRKEAVEAGVTKATEQLVMNVVATSLGNRSLLDFVGGGLKNLGAKLFGTSLWGKRRELPIFAKKSFSKGSNKKS